MHPRSISAATRVVALLGHPVGHSVSPAIHNAAFQAAGIDAVYVAFDVAVGQIERAVAGLHALRLLGANVTVPHKQAVFAAVAARSDAAEASGAANTLFWSGERLVADNTDVEGLAFVLHDEIGIERGDEVVLFGSGGAARAAAVALGRAGAVVEIMARRPDAAGQVGVLAQRNGAIVRDVAQPRLVINATTLGLRAEALPERLMNLRRGQVAFDLVYGPHDTPFVAAARAAGAEVHDGTGMLVAQAAAAFRRWTGADAPRDVMAAAARESLAKK